MSNPLHGADFFALEAGECLDHLEQLITRSDPPAPDEMLRYARALRGSALMAGHPAIARAAAGLEQLARALREGSCRWDAGVRERTGQAIDEFRQLVRRSRDWTSADGGDAARLASELEALAGATTAGASHAAPGSPSEPAELNTGVRAFVARESALIASALDRAARTLTETPDAREPLYAVLRRMQSLRGLAELSELTPLPEVLDGIELAVGDLTRLFAPPPGVDRLLKSAAQALTRIARDVAGSGRPDADPPEARRFTEELLRAFAIERDVVPIESLYVEGDATPMRRPEAQPQFSPPAPPGPVELVSYGEHLAQAADRIVGAESATIRDLRLYALVGTLRSIGSGGGDAVATALVVFGRSAREAIASGGAARAPSGLADALRNAGTLLRSLAEPGDQHAIGRRLLDLAHELDLLGGPAEAGPVEPDAGETAPGGAATAEAPAAEPVAPDESDVVPIRSLEYAPADEAGEAVPIASLAPDAVPAPMDRLETAYAAYARLVRERGVPGGSLDELIGAPPASAPTSQPEPAPDAVDIRRLCYSGRAALERARAVRDTLAAELEAGPELGDVEPLLRELLDLVPLALDAAD
jgi:HPt (histidine-containing phosphotransfer) domain-containing protein